MLFILYHANRTWQYDTRTNRVCYRTGRIPQFYFRGKTVRRVQLNGCWKTNPLRRKEKDQIKRGKHSVCDTLTGQELFFSARWWGLQEIHRWNHGQTPTYRGLLHMPRPDKQKHRHIHGKQRIRDAMQASDAGKRATLRSWKLRLTIMLDDDLAAKLRTKQAKIIQNENKSCSFSKIVNDTLREILWWSRQFLPCKSVGKDLQLLASAITIIQNG